MTDPAAPWPLEAFEQSVAPGVVLRGQACGPVQAPLLVLLHGFPEASFVWERVLRGLAGPFRCVAPDLRGYGASSAPADVAAYGLDTLVDDVAALIRAQAPAEGRARAVVGHDWGGLVAWRLAARSPERLERLVVLNAPHPVLFRKRLADDPAQRSASAYLSFLQRPDAEALLAEADFARLFRLFTNMGADDPGHPGGGWLDPDTRERYRSVWRRGLRGAVNYYRATGWTPKDGAHPGGEPEPPDAARVIHPTLVLWGVADLALTPGLLDGLPDFVPDLEVERWEGATHWLLHERPDRVLASIRRFLAA